jgi:hypothetical protein
MNLPPPPVRPDLDLRAFHYMAVDVVRLRDSEFALRRTGDEFRAGFLLRCASWHQKPASSLPNDDVVLAFLAGYGRDVDAWLRVRDGGLDGFIECSDGRLYHPEIAEKALEAEKQRDINRARTTAATDARRRQRNEDRHDDCDDHQRNKVTEKIKGTKPTSTQRDERVTAARDEKTAAPRFGCSANAGRSTATRKPFLASGRRSNPIQSIRRSTRRRSQIGIPR